MGKALSVSHPVQAPVLFCFLFQKGPTVLGMNLFPFAQILSLKGRPQLEELHPPEKQVGIHESCSL